MISIAYAHLWLSHSFVLLFGMWLGARYANQFRANGCLKWVRVATWMSLAAHVKSRTSYEAWYSDNRCVCACVLAVLGFVFLMELVLLWQFLGTIGSVVCYTHWFLVYWQWVPTSRNVEDQAFLICSHIESWCKVPFSKSVAFSRHSIGCAYPLHLAACSGKPAIVQNALQSCSACVNDSCGEVTILGNAYPGSPIASAIYHLSSPSGSIGCIDFVLRSAITILLTIIVILMGIGSGLIGARISVNENRCLACWFVVKSIASVSIAYWMNSSLDWEKVVSMLMDAGANSNELIYCTPLLSRAIESGLLQVVVELLTKGANVHGGGTFEESALRCALSLKSRQCDACIHQLLLHDLEINYSYELDFEWSGSALHWYASKGDIILVRRLIRLRVDVNLQDSNKKMACDVARANSNHAIAMLLQRESRWKHTKLCVWALHRSANTQKLSEGIKGLIVQYL